MGLGSGLDLHCCNGFVGSEEAYRHYLPASMVLEFHGIRVVDAISLDVFVVAANRVIGLE